MKASVAAAFNAFTDRFEGYLTFMYFDVLGLVTTGRGNLIDPVSAALPLPWLHKDGTPATADQVSAEWARMKGMKAWAPRGGVAFGTLATLHLTRDAVDQLCLDKLAIFEGYLRKRFPGWDSFCADAQLGILSMSWAMGPGFHFPAFQVAANAGDWDAAAANCTINPTGNPGVVPRNVANKALFHNAAMVQANGHYPDVLYYPGTPPVAA